MTTGCTCDDWAPETNKINGPIIREQVRNPHLTQMVAFQFKAWAFCPWCGSRLIRAADPEEVPHGEA